MESSRKPTKDEMWLLEILVQKATVKFPSDWNTNLLVKPLNDEGMGSLQLIPEGVAINSDRLLGEQVSEYQFTDEDGVEVIASLNIDDTGRLFELDIWKTDFSPLIGIPKKLK
jgi:hypothetical protein